MIEINKRKQRRLQNNKTINIYAQYEEIIRVKNKSISQ
jgi:hypothetical protein